MDGSHLEEEFHILVKVGMLESTEDLWALKILLCDRKGLRLYLKKSGSHFF